MAHLGWLAIIASGLLFGQMQNFGGDPEDKKRGEQMISQNQTMITQNRTQIRQNRIAIAIAILALVISLIAVFRPH